MKTTTMNELQVGEWGLFDAVYGPEKILAIDTFALAPPKREAKAIATSSPATDSTPAGIWPALRFYVTTDRPGNPTHRYIIRFPSEPILAMSFEEQQETLKAA